jgi:hypothetical protein
MAGQQRNMEGDNAQRRQAARSARAAGKRPSEVGATLGASKQRKEVKAKAGHQERIEAKHRGKADGGTAGKPRPGNRQTDPKRTERWK